jgi:hypothetical protein
VTVCALIFRSSDNTSLFFWSLIGLCGGIYLFVHGFVLLRRRRLILDTPFSKIRSASMGMVEVSGLAVGPYTMTAPITARPCYYYRTLVWEWKRQGKNSQWVKVAAESMHLPFFLDDNTGKVLVDPRGADLDLHRDFQQEFCDSYFTTKEPAPDNVRSFLARHGIVTSNKIKVEEFCIKPKNSLFILGTLAENPGMEVRPEAVVNAEAALFAPRGISVVFGTTVGNSLGLTTVAETMIASDSQSSSTQVIRLSPEAHTNKAADMTQQQKIAAALTKAGITNPAAWAAAGVADSSAQVNGAPVVMNADQPITPPTNGGDSGIPQGSSHHEFDIRPPVVLMKGTNDKTFLISWRSQQEVARTLGWKCTLMIWGGPALALLSLYVLLSVAHLL